jgi:valyl-tRNA synthetase
VVFSSALWPFATLGWPDQTAALKTFYPNSVMETGYDIIFFWVARMMMMGLHFLGEVPFRRVLLHGMVCDETGSKMSKVKGNVIDPLDLVHGATLEEIVANASGSAPFAGGHQEVPRRTPASDHEGGLPRLRRRRGALLPREPRAAVAQDQPQPRAPPGLPRLLQQDLERHALRPHPHRRRRRRGPRAPSPRLESLAERWILSRLAHAVAEVNKGLDEFRLDEATGAVYQFFWYELCDWYLELCKPVFESGSDAAKASYKRTLAHCLETAHRLLHPFMPHLTEACWAHLPEGSRARRGDALPECLALAPFPGDDDGARDPEAERRDGRPARSIEATRRLCAELGIKPGSALAVTFRSPDAARLGTLEAYDGAIRRLTRAKATAYEVAPAGAARPKGSGYAVTHGVEMVVPLAGLIDPAAEGARLEKDRVKSLKEAEGIAKRLANKDFVARAPAEVVEKDRARCAELRDRAARLEAALSLLSELG